MNKINFEKTKLFLKKNFTTISISFLIVLITTASILFLNRKDEKSEDFSNLDSISQIYSKMKENKIEEAKSISNQLPQLDKTNIYFAPKEVVEKLKSDQLIEFDIETINAAEYRDATQLLPSKLTSVTEYRVLDIDQKASVYFEDINKDLKDSTQLEKFFRFNSTNSLLPHEIIQISGGMSDNDLNMLKASPVFLGLVTYNTNYDWEDLDKLSVFELQNNDQILYGVIYTFKLSEEKSMVHLDIYDYDNKPKLQFSYLISEFNNSTIESDLQKLRTEIISEGLGIYY